MANLWYVAAYQYDDAEHSRRIKEMGNDACTPELHEMGFKHEHDSGDSFPGPGPIVEHNTGTHILPLEGGFHVRTYPYKDILNGKEGHRISVDDGTSLGDHITKHLGFNGEGGSNRFNEYGGIHPDFMHEITAPARMTLHDPEHLPAGVKALLTHPETMRAMRESQRARNLTGRDLENACAEHRQHVIRADGTSDTRSVAEKGAEDNRKVFGDDWDPDEQGGIHGL